MEGERDKEKEKLGKKKEKIKISSVDGDERKAVEEGHGKSR